jgi:dTDP-D-glucose 4,6-dehydratase
MNLPYKEQNTFVTGRPSHDRRFCLATHHRREFFRLFFFRASLRQNSFTATKKHKFTKNLANPLQVARSNFFDFSIS